ncbi:MAG: formate/nitrite transporter family protein [Planctomycetota bacterium]|nr:MAG: formate/nitrite transporter family protein [Planctomycetota bacterium]
MADGNFSNDAFQPAQIARRVESMGVTKAKASVLTILLLAVLAGAFISLGANFFIVVTTENSELGFGVTRLLGGMSFSLGLVLVVIGGAELFTGNNLLAMSWVSRLITTRSLLRHWGLAYLGNVLGCLTTVAIVACCDLDSLSGGAVGRTAIQIAQSKAELGWGTVFFRGVLCNALVCLAVWLAMGGRTVSDKIMAIMFPVTAFVAMGLEHSIANWYFLPLGMLWDPDHTISASGVIRNLIASTLGNLAGGTLLVAGVYWMVYLRETNPPVADSVCPSPK